MELFSYIIWLIVLAVVIWMVSYIVLAYPIQENNYLRSIISGLITVILLFVFAAAVHSDLTYDNCQSRNLDIFINNTSKPITQQIISCTRARSLIISTTYLTLGLLFVVLVGLLILELPQVE